MVNSTFASLEPKAFTANSNYHNCVLFYSIRSLQFLLIHYYLLPGIKKLILRNNSFGNIHSESLNIEISESINFQQNMFIHLDRRAFAGKEFCPKKQIEFAQPSNC